MLNTTDQRTERCLLFALVCAEFSDVDSGDRVTVQNAVTQRILVDCLEGKLPPGSSAGRVVLLGMPPGISQ